MNFNFDLEHLSILNLFIKYLNFVGVIILRYLPFIFLKIFNLLFHHKSLFVLFQHFMMTRETVVKEYTHQE